jgi:nucleoside-diphosphate-sugar epimerase
MRIGNHIIFGSSGFIGHHFKYFLNHDECICLDITPVSGDYFLDIRTNIFLDQDFNPSDVIINLAAIHRTPGHPDYDYFETNIRGAENVCTFAEKKGINNIIFTSSIAPYGAGEDLKTETTLPTPNTPYGISKLVAEHIHIEWAAKDPKRKLLIIRPGVVFGQGENGNYTRLYKAIKSGTFFYPGRKDTIKACIYVKDLVQLSFQIFNSYESGVRTYNFTYEPAPTIEEIVETMCEVVGKNPPKLLVNGKLLKSTAAILGPLGFNKIGIHPDRVKKLMLSTNISGKKILEYGYSFQYNLKNALEDWYNDCNRQGLF